MAGTIYQSVDKDNVYTKPTRDAGSGLFATGTIRPKDLVLQVIEPLVSAIDTPRLKDTCYHCLQSVERSEIGNDRDTTLETSLKACTGCRVVKYCKKVGHRPHKDLKLCEMLLGLRCLE